MILDDEILSEGTSDEKDQSEDVWDAKDMAEFEVDFATAANMFSGKSYEEAREEAIRDRREFYEG